VLTPTLKKVAPPLDARFSDYFGAERRLAITSLGNLLGWPCVTLPCGFGERGLPISLQLVGRPGGEATLLTLADHYQRQTDWHLRRPPVG
jgi:aspartyl-tRNA(Asn)/glutamyl-tRNA(Gln) amidotransferase subunit A